MKIQILIVNHESQPVKSNIGMYCKVFISGMKKV